MSQERNYDWALSFRSQKLLFWDDFRVCFTSLDMEREFIDIGRMSCLSTIGQLWPGRYRLKESHRHKEDVILRNLSSGTHPQELRKQELGK